MKRFLIEIVIFSLAVISYFAYEFTTMPIAKSNFAYMLNVKDSLLQHVPWPRVVFLGGSSLAYGIQSPTIRDSLNMNIINCGISAGFGLKYILDEATPLLRKGDIVVIVLEYNHLYALMYGSSATIAPAMFYSGMKNIHMLNNKQMQYFIAGIPTTIRMNKDDGKKQHYCTETFNKEGDACVRNATVLHREHNTPFSPPVNEEFGKCFLQQVERIEKKGCQVIIVPQPICQSSYQKDVAADLSSWLARHGHPFAATPEEHVMDDKYGYDTDNHMSEEGAEIFTQKIIKELKKNIDQ